MKLPKYMQKNAGPIQVFQTEGQTLYIFTDDEGEHWHPRHPSGDYDPKIPLTCKTCCDVMRSQGFEPNA